MKSTCVVLQQSGRSRRDTTYLSKNMHGLPVSRVCIVNLSVFLCIFQDAYECFCGILSALWLPPVSIIKRSCT